MYEHLFMYKFNFILYRLNRTETVTCKSEHQKERVGKLSYFCYFVLTHTLSIYRPDEDIEMTVCEPYSLHQSKPTDENKVIYDECQLSTTDIADTSVYELI